MPVLGLVVSGTYPDIPVTWESFVEVPRAYQVIKTPYEAGYAQTRPKVTTAPRQFQITHKNVLAADRATWMAFWDTQVGGAGIFTFTNPLSGEVVPCRFKHDASNPPPVVPIGSGNVGFTIGPIMLEEAL